MVKSDLFTDHRRFEDLDTWRREAVAMHADGPIQRVDASGYEPFWAVIGNNQVRAIELDSETFTNAPNPVIYPGTRSDVRGGLDMLIHMDPPQHTAHRRVTADWFKPTSLNGWTARIEDIVTETLDRLVDADHLGADRWGAIDFGTEVAVPIPLRAILDIFGLPEQDYAAVLRFSNLFFGNRNPAANPAVPGDLGFDPMAYFTQLTDSRRANPSNDLASAIANGQIDGAPMGDLETLSYYLIIVTAGHETTSSAMADGLATVVTTGQYAELRSSPELVDNATEEMLRWSAPVHHFMRTAQRDITIDDAEIRKGDWVMLSYSAANMDPAVFDDPLRFDIARPHADRHLAFGAGRHHCLGAGLARMEMRLLFAQLIERFDQVELAAPPTQSSSNLLGGVTELPIRYHAAGPASSS